MKRLGIIAVMLVGVLSALWLARAAVPQGQPAAPRFVPVDLFLDTGAKRLGAYQVEVQAKDAKMVGLEGGDPGAFNKPPFYDPAALAGATGAGGDKIIVAAFSTDENLPTGLTRVARLHLLAEGAGGQVAAMPELTSKLVVATDGQGKTVDAKVILRPMQGETR